MFCVFSSGLRKTDEKIDVVLKLRILSANLLMA